MAETIRQSSIRLVYPFSFNPDEFSALVDAFEEQRFEPSKPTSKDLPQVWKQKDNGDDPYRAQAWAEPVVRRFIHDLGPDGKRNLYTWNSSMEFLTDRNGLAQNLDWQFETKGNSEKRNDGELSEPIALKVEGMVVTLMRHGAGLIAMDIQPKKKACTTERYFRFMTRAVHPNRRGQGFRVMKSSFDAGERTFRPVWPGAFPAPEDGNSPQPLYRLFEHLLFMHSPNHGRWWNDVYPSGMLIPYFTLVVDGLDPEMQGLVRLQAIRMATNRDSLDPSDAQLAADATGSFHFSRSSWFVSSPAGVGYLAFDPKSDFHRNTVPKRLWNSDLPGWCLFALTMQQRIALQNLSTEVISGWQDKDKLRKFSQTKTRLMAFIAQAYFSRVAVQSNLYSEFYKLMFQQFSLRESYETVCGEVSTLHDHLQHQHAKDLDKTVRVYGVPLAITSLVLGFLGVNIAQFTSSSEGLPWAPTIGVVAAVGLLAWWIAKKWHDGRWE